MASKSSFKLFQNRFVLYLVLFLALTNMLGYLAVNNWKAITYFIMISLIVNYFTKNMIIILGSAILLTNLLVVRRNMFGLSLGFRREGMENKEDTDEEDEDHGEKGKKSIKEGLTKKTNQKNTENMDVKKNRKQREIDEEESSGTSTSHSKSKQQGFGQRNVPSSQPASADGSDDMEDDDAGIGKRIDYASTLEQAYDNLQNVLGSDGVSGLTKETKQLIQQQKSLMETMKSIQPMMDNAKDMMKGFDMGSINKTLSQVQGMMSSVKSLGVGGSDKK
jgi:hypothetical protein